jgi:endonuclease III
MQHLLTQEELDALVPKKDFEQMRETALELARLLSYTLPPNKNGPGPRSHGCIRDGETEYCSFCPAEDLCPYKFKQHGK